MGHTQNTKHQALSTKHYSVKEAQDLIVKEAWNFGFEEVRLNHASGRVLSENVYADRNYPPFNRSAVDGFAINSRDLLKEKEFLIIEEVHAGSIATKAISYKTAIKIMTGAPVPEGADAVIKVEDAEVLDNIVAFSLHEIRTKANISYEGEDTKKGEIVLPKNQLCTPQVLSALAALGKHKVKVYKKPSVAIISTGSEVKEVEEEILPHHIRDSNTYALIGFLQHYMIEPVHKEIIPDDKEKLREAIEKVFDADIIILSGGVSMGDADFIPEVLYELGVEKIFHKAAIKPGKPIWFGTTEKNVVFALPGNPFSVQVAFKIFIEPYLRSCLGLPLLQSLKLPLNGNKKKKTSFDEYFPCRISDLQSTSLEIISFNGSGDITAALNSDGIALHPFDQHEILKDQLVEFLFWKSF